VSSGVLADAVNRLALSPNARATMPLSNAEEHMEWRLALVDHATKPINIQYFICSSDEAGVLLLDDVVTRQPARNTDQCIADFSSAAADRKSALKTGRFNFRTRYLNRFVDR
jgi:phosphatidylserine/phosphatidylglycerophosphate/cardiolipin synthase-like enzyme